MKFCGGSGGKDEADVDGVDGDGANVEADVEADNVILVWENVEFGKINGPGAKCIFVMISITETDFWEKGTWEEEGMVEFIKFGGSTSSRNKTHWIKTKMEGLW